MIIKHLMPVARRSAALFMLLGFRCYKKHDRNFYIFCTNVTEIKDENKKSSGASVVFTEFIYLKVFGLVFFFYFVSVIFNCQHCSVHKKFCKEEKTCSVVSTLNMSRANKRFNV